jgi:hypothetical protein
MRTITIRVPGIIIGLLLVLAAPRATFACAACAGRSDDAMTQGLNAAVLTLLAVLLVVLGAVIGSVAYLIRRAVKRPLALPTVPRGVVH